jgi:hypothetical protein
VPYLVHTADEVVAYLNDLRDISEGARRCVVEAYLRDLAEKADDYLRWAPIAHESYTFQYQYVLVDGGFCYCFRFIADGSAMPYGVVKVLYVDHEARPFTA